MKKFDAAKTKEELVQWIRDWFEFNGKGLKAVIGISGGKDSTVVAALCSEALGKERVVGVMMPNLSQADIQDSVNLIEHLGIRGLTLPVTVPVADILSQIEHLGIKASEQTVINLPPRIRMSVLYAVSQSVGGRVANTSNLSESWIGYGTRFGDSGTGDFCPIKNLTSSEVVEIGHALDIPKHLVDKAPSDGLCGKTDEDNFGFTYRELDAYIRTGKCENEAVKERIDKLHCANLFKLSMPPSYDPGLDTVCGRLNHGKS